ncbi:hypothetical protein JD81_00087 [Micromonospora sagamiensis]|uniref:Uncharacterized protein n=1 Tax=Micromonospora sagamiensis TaxID=47875 RepID=A0A562W9I4_9ACTN|nr:hypothetical protein JD81_00087 [Micromonospora sagamiensis]
MMRLGPVGWLVGRGAAGLIDSDCGMPRTSSSAVPAGNERLDAIEE